MPHLPYVTDDSEVSEEELKRAEIPVERINGPVLLIAASDDAVWSSERLSKVAMERLERHGHPYDDELVVYPEAGHLIQAPYVPAAWGVGRFGGNAKSRGWGSTRGLSNRRGRPDFECRFYLRFEPLSFRVSCIRRAAMTPAAKGNSATSPMDHPAPRISANAPAMRAPKA
jgi:hypothetical protein